MLWHLCTMLQHIAQCHGILHNAMAYCTMPWHKKQHHSTKQNAVAQKTALLAHCQCCGMQKAPQHKAQHHGTKTWQNATAHHGRPWHKAQCHSTNHIATEQSTMLQQKNRAAAQKQHCNTKTVLWHKKLLSSTKCNAAVHKTALWHKNSTAECCGGMHNAMEKTTMTVTPLRPPKPKPKPNRLIVSPQKTTKQKPPQKHHNNKAKITTMMPLWWPMPLRLIVFFSNPC